MYLPLDEPIKKALLDYARREDRDPRVQAVRFVREGLKQAGALTDTTRQTTAPAGPDRAA